MILVLLGAPGSGKGTQAKALCAKYGFNHLSTGDIFRGEMSADTALGAKAAEYVKAGRLVPDSIVTEMVAGRMELDGSHYLLDGFPRNLEQARSLAEILAQEKAAVDIVILLNLPQAEALKRLTSRRVCASCGEVFNTITRRPATQGQCDRCSGKLFQREDDTAATAEKRLMVFDDITHPLAAYYKAEQVFQEVDASKSADEVTAALCAVVDRVMAVP